MRPTWTRRLRYVVLCPLPKTHEPQRYASNSLKVTGKLGGLIRLNEETKQVNRMLRASIAADRQTVADYEDRYSIANLIKRFDYDPQRDEPLTATDFAVYIAIDVIAFIFAVIAFYYFFSYWNYAPFFQPACPFNVQLGLTCSGNGVCTQYGYCDCSTNPLFSGSDCSITACPGADTGDICNGNGLCSPFMTIQAVPAPCFWTTPTPENAFNPPNLGWDDPGCKAYLDEKRAELLAIDPTQVTDETLVQLNLFGVPSCLCFGSLDGPQCEVEACPRNTENQICSNNGNKSVTTFTNNTITGSLLLRNQLNTDVPLTGNGCQCFNVFNFIDSQITAQLSYAAVRI